MRRPLRTVDRGPSISYTHFVFTDLRKEGLWEKSEDAVSSKFGTCGLPSLPSASVWILLDRAVRKCLGVEAAHRGVHEAIRKVQRHIAVCNSSRKEGVQNECFLGSKTAKSVYRTMQMYHDGFHADATITYRTAYERDAVVSWPGDMPIRLYASRSYLLDCVEKCVG